MLTGRFRYIGIAESTEGEYTASNDRGETVSR